MSSQIMSVTQLLKLWQQGDEQAAEDLIASVYQNLKSLAGSMLLKERNNHTLQTTALVNEAWLKLIDQSRTDWQSRGHFMAIAAQAMRRILIDHARKKQSRKRFNEDLQWALNEELFPQHMLNEDILVLDQALNQLSQWEASHTQMIEMHYFIGMGIQDIADTLGLSRTTVWRELKMAMAWLKNYLKHGY
ncbi:MAG: ECF-type sigma factor [Marinicella sp.]